MENTSKNKKLSERDILYYRYRFQNRVYQSVIAYFAMRAEQDGLTKAILASIMDKEPSQITRWFSGPGNWTLDTVSDLLLGMDAEMSVNPITFSNYEVVNPVALMTQNKSSPTVVTYYDFNKFIPIPQLPPNTEITPYIAKQATG